MNTAVSYAGNFETPGVSTYVSSPPSLATGGTIGTNQVDFNVVEVGSADAQSFAAFGRNGVSDFTSYFVTPVPNYFGSYGQRRPFAKAASGWKDKFFRLFA